MMCQACEEGRHEGCGMQTWCSCDCPGPDGHYTDDWQENSCSRCNAGMPSLRVNPLCEECFAEDSDEYDTEAEID